MYLSSQKYTTFVFKILLVNIFLLTSMYSANAQRSPTEEFSRREKERPSRPTPPAYRPERPVSPAPPVYRPERPAYRPERPVSSAPPVYRPERPTYRPERPVSSAPNHTRYPARNNEHFGRENIQQAQRAREERLRQINNSYRANPAVEQARRDQIRQRYIYRDRYRSQLSRYSRPLPGGRNYYDIHSSYWNERYYNWYYGYYRPVPPTYTDWIILDPIYDRPSHGDFWDRYDILKLADLLEVLTFKLYDLANEELQEELPANQETLALIYDVAIAAQVYSNAAEKSTNVFKETLFELFNLEESAQNVQSRLLCAGLSLKWQSNFNQVVYYIAELLWQYRLDAKNGAIPSINKSQAFNKEGENLLVSSFELNSGAHLSLHQSCLSEKVSIQAKEADKMWVVSAVNNNFKANELVISVNSKFAQAQRKGLVGITALYLYYTDGTIVNLIHEATLQKNPAVNGQLLVIRSAQDQLLVKINNQKVLHAIYVKAENWEASSRGTDLSLALRNNLHKNK